MKKFNAISWIINNECNFKCRHCYTGAESNVPRGNLSKVDLQRIRENLEGIKFNYMFISGGEPLLCPNFFDYVDVCKACNPNNIFILTNGYQLNKELLHRCRERGITGFSVGLQHFEALGANYLYGIEDPNAYDRILHNAMLIKDMGFTLYIDTVIMKTNYLYLDKIIDIASKVGADNITFKRYASIGRGKSQDMLKVSSEEHMEALEMLYEYKRGYQGKLKITVHDPLFNTIIYNHLEGMDANPQRYFSEYAGCYAGVQWLGIDPMGNVLPCPLMLHTGPILGNVKNDKLMNILDNSEELRILRSAKKNNVTCKYGKICAGCRCEALNYNGNFRDSDVLCPYKGKCPIEEVQYE